MKKLLCILVLSLLTTVNSSLGEIVKIDCTANFSNGQSATNYFELNSDTDDYYAKFVGDKIFWTTVTDQAEGKYRPLYHNVDRRTGQYGVEFGVVTDKFPEKNDNMVKIETVVFGSCKASTSKKLF